MRLEACKEVRAAFEFQSTHPRGVRQVRRNQFRGSLDFNPRTHVGCDYGLSKRCKSFFYFNPRTHVGCDFTALRFFPAKPFQSTHPRGVRPRQIGGQKALHISIHAPTWGATLERIRGVGLALISIHAPTWGATSHRDTRTSAEAISIHAPTWGATNGAGTYSRPVRFQSTHPRGVRRL